MKNWQMENLLTFLKLCVEIVDSHAPLRLCHATKKENLLKAKPCLTRLTKGLLKSIRTNNV